MSFPPPPSGKAPASQVPRQTLDWLPWYPIGLAALYVAGYVVANTHYARYESLRPNLLNSRYIAAGLLWALFTCIPILFAVVTVGYVRVHWAARDRIKAGFSALTLPLLSAGYAYSLMDVLGAKTSPLSAILYGVGCYLTAVAWLGTSLIPSDWDSGAPDADRAFRTTRYFVAPIVAWALFGLTVYPRILPQFGGAAAHMMRLQLEPRELQAAVGDRFLPVIDQDEAFVYVLVCSRAANAGPPQTLAIPIRSIGSMSVVQDGEQSSSFIVVPELASSPECAGMSRKPARWY